MLIYVPRKFQDGRPSCNLAWIPRFEDIKDAFYVYGYLDTSVDEDLQFSEPTEKADRWALPFLVETRKHPAEVASNAFQPTKMLLSVFRELRKREKCLLEKKNRCPGIWCTSEAKVYCCFEKLLVHYWEFLMGLFPVQVSGKILPLNRQVVANDMDPLQTFGPYCSF